MFRKLLKGLAGATLLAAMALPGIAQQLTVSREVPQQAAPKKAAPTKVSLQPKYLVAFGKPLARTDKNGITKFNYQNGRIFSEIQPNGVVGTYQYDSGKFTGIVYTDGRYVRVVYNANGALSGLITNTGARVTFTAPSKKPPRLSGFLAIQNGMAALRNPSTSNECIGTDGDASCTVHVDESMPDDSGWGGGGGIGGGYFDEMPLSGEGEGAIHNPPGETPAECRANVCVPINRTFRQYCDIATRTPADSVACINKTSEYYANCAKSCETNDWSWLAWWVFIW